MAKPCCTPPFLLSPSIKGLFVYKAITFEEGKFGSSLQSLKYVCVCTYMCMCVCAYTDTADTCTYI